MSLSGVSGHLVEVEVHLASGLPAIQLVGLPDSSLLEARDRVRAAVINSGQDWPGHRITINLSPASLPKRGSSFDLAIAAAVLAAHGAVPATAFARTVLLAELGLDGRVRPVRGVLPAVAAAARAQVRRVVVAEPDTAEAALVPDVEVIGVRSLRQLVALARGEVPPEEPAVPVVPPAPVPTAAAEPDLVDVLGQPIARWALEVAAAGGHHLLLLGPPGVGKTMLAERLPGLLPDLDRATALEVTAIHSVAGVLRGGSPLVRRPPYQAPHHTATVAAVVGGGSGVPRPGAASLAHRGVLFLDEAPEFATGVLDALREPLESGTIALARAGGTADYPARFSLVLAANPCPCGMAIGKGLDCTCTPMQKRRYLIRLSGPLLDRVDLRLDVAGPSPAQLVEGALPEGTAPVAERVAAARERTRRRLEGAPWSVNGEVPGRELRRRWPLAPGALREVDAMLARGGLTLRGAERVLRVAWSVADLRGRSRPGSDEVHAALSLRAPGTRAA